MLLLVSQSYLEEYTSYFVVGNGKNQRENSLMPSRAAFDAQLKAWVVVEIDFLSPGADVC